METPLPSKRRKADNIERKIFNDPIHGSMEFHPLIVKVMNTREFQRLKDIKQLGVAHYVYPAASHNRFEHSLGTCHLAGKLARHLYDTNQIESVKIDYEVDVLCVELAGLCHDLGHGPFSHLFDDIFLREDEYKKGKPGNMKTKELRKHERRSCVMLDYLIEKNDLEGEFERWHIYRPQRNFIKCMIDTPKDWKKGLKENYEKSYGHDKVLVAEEKLYGHNKEFLAEIISNKRNGVDVDKFDYLARDCYMSGLKSSFDHNRFMKFMKVLPDDKGELQLCTRDKETKSIYELFHVRTHLHSRLCSHEAAKVVEVMLSDALLEADEHFCMGEKDETGKPLKLSNAYESVECFAKLTDSVFYGILNSEKELESARNILMRILNRKLYRRFDDKAFQIDVPEAKSDVEYAHEIEKQIAEKIDQEHLKKFVKVQIMKMKFGGGKSVKEFKVYGKKETTCKVADMRETELYKPQNEEKELLLAMYTEEFTGKSPDPTKDNFEVAKAAFDEWKKEYPATDEKNEEEL